MHIRSIVTAGAAFIITAASSTPTITSQPVVALVRAPDAGIQPQIAVDGSGATHLVYFTGDPAHGDVFYTRTRGATGFLPAVRVNSQPGSALATGNVRGGRLAIGRNGRVHVTWVGSSQTHAPGSPAPVFYTRMTDDDSAFEPQRNVTRGETIGPDGASLAADAAGRVYVTWHAQPPGVKGEEGRRLWMVRSLDDGRTFAPERAVSEAAVGACGCCGTAALVDRRGALYFSFRAAREAVHRDSYLMRSTDHAATFESKSLQAWDVNVCPMSTFALAEAPAGGPVVAAWETAGSVFWTHIDPRSGTPSAVVSVGGADNNKKHPAIAMNARGETLVAWTEGMGFNKGGSVAWQMFDASGKPTVERGGAPDVPASSLVAVYGRPDGGFTIVY